MTPPAARRWRGWRRRPPPLPDDRRTITFEQTDIVHGSGSVFAVQHGDQHAYGTGGRPDGATVPE
ncbi:hypothetical protein [Streptomyces sp. NBC_01014]|uniref:hypothetical protein n=1 Tax=Streptomyces sp. NBC_01014 TaxID=2903719 RepID=UPI003864965D|nr:hypothetical protein OG282_21660 [Streptomyces sp. NBC_01014]